MLKQNFWIVYIFGYNLVIFNSPKIIFNKSLHLNHFKNILYTIYCVILKTVKYFCHHPKYSLITNSDF